MRIESMQDLFNHKINDIYDMEVKISEALPMMIEKANSQMLKDSFQNHLEETNGQIKRLEEIAAMTNFELGQGDCKGIKGILEEGKDIMNSSDFENVADAVLVMSAATVEHYEISKYRAAVELSKQLGIEECVELLEKSLEEEEKTATMLETILKTGKKDLNWGEKIMDTLGL